MQREDVLTAVIPPRQDPSVHGLAFVSNRVLHSGVDDEFGRFIAAYEWRPKRSYNLSVDGA